MKVLRVGTICYLCFSWTVYTSSVYQTSYICRKQDVNSKEKAKPEFSVLDSNLMSCAVTCHTKYDCMYFVYNRHSKRCYGYSEKLCDSGEDGEAASRSAGGLSYQRTCKKKCAKQATYRMHIKTGKERGAGSKADLVLIIKGRCGQIDKELKNGKDIKLKSGLRKKLRKFKSDSVCGVRAIGLAFSDPCHKDDWFVEYVLVNTEEMETGDRGQRKFKIKSWLSARGKKTTGILCTCVPSVGLMFLKMKCQHAPCRPNQTYIVQEP